MTQKCDSNDRCTVVSSTRDAIPVGSTIASACHVDGPDRMSHPMIMVKGGTATGQCNWDQPQGEVLAKCGFATGTGRLSGLELAFDVTFDGDPGDPAAVWHWDGFYGFEPPVPTPPIVVPDWLAQALRDAG